MGSNSYTKEKLSFSKNCLFDALISLLKEKDLGDISVSELVRKAGVGRSTFYRNYDNILDIIIQFLRDRPMGFESLMTYEDYTNEERVAEYFTYLEANKELFQILAGQKFQHILLENMESAFRGPFRPIVEKMGYTSEYEISAFTGIVFMVTRDWLLNDMQPPKEKMIAFSANLITRQ